MQNIINDSLDFPIPLVPINDNIYSLELFHGPTLAFKDVGARFMARLLAYFLEKDNQEITVLVATSGDTGSAVAHGFYNVPGIRVVLLYPSGMVSKIQEQQLTTLGNNITALEVTGTFDDCQKIVKQAFLDQDIRNKINLTSANSINLGRLIPQSFYYFYAYSQIKDIQKKLFICVPSGNFGNLTAGLIAKRMGLPVDKFIAATNINDIIPKYLLSGNYEPEVSKNTISNAMDVGNPSNFARILDLYDNGHKSICHDITGYSCTDETTRTTMLEVFNKYGYILDPHGAVGYNAISTFLKNDEAIGIFLETAHPAKFLDIVEPVIGRNIPIPASLESALSKEKKSIPIAGTIDDLKEFLLSSTQ